MYVYMYIYIYIYIFIYIYICVSFIFKKQFCNGDFFLKKKNTVFLLISTTYLRFLYVIRAFSLINLIFFVLYNTF